MADTTRPTPAGVDPAGPRTDRPAARPERPADPPRGNPVVQAARRAAPSKASGVLVVGLGRFGSALALTLEKLGHDVLAVERSPQLVQQFTGRFPLVEADATNPDALVQVSAKDFAVAVVGVGTSLEASMLITANLVDLGVEQIWAKAITPEHARILSRIGAHHVVFPEADAGNRVAHLVSGKLLDYIEVEGDFTIVKMRPPRETQGFDLAQSKVRTRYGVTILGVKSPGVEFQYATPQTRIAADDILIVAGHPELLERFAARP